MEAFNSLPLALPWPSWHTDWRQAQRLALPASDKAIVQMTADHAAFRVEIFRMPLSIDEKRYAYTASSEVRELLYLTIGRRFIADVLRLEEHGESEGRVA